MGFEEYGAVLFGICAIVALICIFWEMPVKGSLAGKLSKVIFYIPLLLGLAVLWFKLWADGRKIARLHTEIEQARERAKNLLLKEKLEKIGHERRRIDVELGETRDQIELLEGTIAEEAKSHVENFRTFDAIDSWDSFFAYAKGTGDEDPPCSHEG